MVAENDHLAPLVASSIAIKSLIFFSVNKKGGESWLHKPAVNPKVNDDLYPAVVVEDIKHYYQQEGVTEKSLYELCQQDEPGLVTSFLRYNQQSPYFS